LLGRHDQALPRPHQPRGPPRSADEPDDHEFKADESIVSGGPGI